MTTGEGLIADIREEFLALQALAEKAAAQLDDESFVRQLDAESNSVALIMKHVGGNLRSRWTDVLTTDGEKPDRDRDGEFEARAGDSRSRVEAKWADGWQALFTALDGLGDADLVRPVVIRGQTMTLSRALARSLAHTAGHVHQIVLLAKHFRGPAWQTLSLPRAPRPQA